MSVCTGAGAASGCRPLCCLLLSAVPCTGTDSQGFVHFRISAHSVLTRPVILADCPLGVRPGLRRAAAKHGGGTSCRLQVAWWRGCLCAPHTSEAALTARGPDRAFPRRGACRISSLHRHLGPSPGRRAKLQRPQVGARAEALVSWAQNPLICWQPQRAQSKETGTSVET